MAPVTTQGLELAVALSLFHRLDCVTERCDAHGRQIHGFLVLLTCTLLGQKTGCLQNAKIKLH